MDSVQKNGARSVKRQQETGYKDRKISAFARRLLTEWKRLALPLAGEVVVAVSGGADSTALLLGLDELVKTERLALEVTVAHLNHGLRGQAGEEDARWVKEMASGLGFKVTLGHAAVKERAARSSDNLEQAARRARYEFLSEAALEYRVRIVLTAHTMDDQAETVLLRLLRGGGAEGLSGIETVRRLDTQHDTLLVRPLLRWARRVETENYCRERGVRFRVDEMNADERYARVRVRRQLIPLLETFNGRAVETLSRTAELLRDDAATLGEEAAKLLKAASEEATGRKRVIGIAEAKTLHLSIDVLAGAPPALRRRALRQWLARGRGDLRRLEFDHILAVERLLVGERGGRIALLPGGAFVERRRRRLHLRVKNVEKGAAAD